MPVLINEQLGIYEVTHEEDALHKYNKNICEGQLVMCLNVSNILEQAKTALKHRQEKRRATIARKAAEKACHEPAYTLFDYIRKITVSKESLIQDNLALVDGVLQKIRYPSWIPYEELQAEGRLALVMAAKNYDPSRKVRFSYYAYRCIWNAIIRKVDTEGRYGRSISLDYMLNGDGDTVPSIDRCMSTDGVDIPVTSAMKEAICYIEQAYAKRPSILQGLRAILLHMNGYKFCDIAKSWNITANLLTAIVSRTHNTFRKDRRLAELLLD